MSKAPGALGAEERVWIDTAGEKNGRAKAGDRAGASFYRPCGGHGKQDGLS